jgi:hypothetical protein
MALICQDKNCLRNKRIDHRQNSKNTKSTVCQYYQGFRCSIPGFNQVKPNLAKPFDIELKSSLRSVISDFGFGLLSFEISDLEVGELMVKINEIFTNFKA